MIKILINKILGSFGYKCINIKNIIKSAPKKEIDRFSLNTGERQVAVTLEDIRRDHIVRYQMASDFLLNNYKSTSNLYGGDIFCGNGYGSHIISNKINCKTIGIDASSDAIALANKYYSNDQTLFVVKKFPFKLPENIFDFIISFETIEHVVEDKELVQEFTKSLKSGGYLFLSAPNEEICSFAKNNYEFHVKHYTFKDIVELISSSAQFDLTNWYGNGAYNFVNGSIINYNQREEKEMEMKEMEFDSHLTYIFKKK